MFLPSLILDKTFCMERLLSRIDKSYISLANIVPDVDSSYTDNTANDAYNILVHIRGKLIILFSLWR